jgi:hypothetical protein
MVVLSAQRLPSVYASSANSAYDRSYFYSSVGFTLLLAALSLWLLRTGLWPRPSGGRADVGSKSSLRNVAEFGAILILSILGGILLGYLKHG